MNNVFERFVSKWSVLSTSKPGRRPETVDSLNQIEKALAVTLPERYVEFMLSVGEVWTPEILDSVVDLELEMPDIQSMLSFQEAEDLTRGWREIGLPENLIVIATDCMGNMFCFDGKSCLPPRCQDLPVYFYDHDFDTTRKVADSFEALLAGYLDLEKGERRPDQSGTPMP
jgi:hypothetical protein